MTLRLNPYPKRETVLPETALAVIPLLSYCLAYEFERGHCDYYGLPSSVIDLSLWSIVGLSLATFGAAVIVLIVVNHLGTIVLSTGAFKSLSGFHPGILGRWLVLVPIFFVPMFYLLDWGGRLLFLSLLILFGSLDFLLPLWRFRGRSWREAINDAEEFEMQSLTRPIELLPRRLRWLPLAIIFGCFSLTNRGIKCIAFCGCVGILHE